MSEAVGAASSLRLPSSTPIAFALELMTSSTDNSGSDASSEARHKDDEPRDASSPNDSMGGGGSDGVMTENSEGMEDEDGQHIERVRRPTTQPVQVMGPEIDTAEYPTVTTEQQASQNAYFVAMREQLRQSRIRPADEADTAPVENDDTPTKRRDGSQRHRRPTSEHDAVTKRSPKIDKMCESLDDASIEYVDLHPLYRFSNEIERLGGIAWTLDAVGETLAQGNRECTSVVLRLQSKRVLVWVRDSSHGLLIVAPISSERKILGIVREAEEAHD